MNPFFNFIRRLSLCVLPGLLSFGLVHASPSNVTFLSFPGAQSTSAGGINNDRTVVGYYWDAQRMHIHGFIFHDGIYQTLDVPGATNTYLFDINNNGTIVGSYDDVFGFRHGVLIHNGQYLTLDLPDATWMQPNGVSDLGRVAGSHGISDRKVGGVIYDGETFTSLNFSGNDTTVPYKINNSGHVVAHLFSENEVRGFVYDGSSWQQFTPPGIPPTVSFCEALGINNRGDIVGSFVTDNGFVPYFWDSGSNVTTFLPLPDARACDVNDQGDVVGQFGPDQVFLVTAIPEPSAPLLIGTGLAILAVRFAWTPRRGAGARPGGRGCHGN